MLRLPLRRLPVVVAAVAVAAQRRKGVDQQQPEPVVVAAGAAVPLLKVEVRQPVVAPAAQAVDAAAQRLRARRPAAPAVAHLRLRPSRRRSLLTVFIS